METGFKITGMEELKAGLTDLAKEQFPFAMALALTRTAQDIQTAEVAEMKKVFDRPTPWTLGSVFIQPATKDNHTATVWLKDREGMWGKGSTPKSGTPAVDYLTPEIEGGARNLKRHEKALQYIGVLPPGMYCVPGAGADLDAYGNMKASQIIQILSYFKAFGTPVSGGAGFRANITDTRKEKLKGGTKKQRGYEYFAIRDRGSSHLKPGIYKRISFGSFGAAIKPIIMFVKPPGYKQRFDFFGVGNKVADNMLVRQFDLALEAALAKVR